MVPPANISLQMDGSSVASGRTASLLGKSFQTSKSPTQSKLLSLLFRWELPLNMVSTGGCFCPQEERHNLLACEHRNVNHLKKTQNYSLPMQKLVDDALTIDRCTGSTLWADAIVKEMKNVRVAFNALEDGRNGSQFVKCHMIFDIKMEDFNWKACLVAGGHIADIPAKYTYTIVVTDETVRIALMLAALSSMEVMMADILNAYINALFKEKIWTNLGSEFGKVTPTRRLRQVNRCG